MNEKIIIIPTGKRQVLALQFDVSVVTIWSALIYKTNSELAQQIRAAALMESIGGQIYRLDTEQEE